MDATMTMRDADQLVAAGGKFLRAISVKPGIMQLMIGLGYSEAEQRQGWDYYLKMLGYVAPAKMLVTAIKDTDQAHAMLEIDRYDEPAFSRAEVALARLHPDQYTYIFGDGLSPQTGPASMGSVQTFLDRYAALRDGTDPARADRREADKAAAATLEARNIVSPKIERHLRDLIDIVKSGTQAQATSGAASEEALQAATQTFAQWFHDWRTTAAAGITRRDFRILLGISRRRVNEAEPEVTPIVTSTPPAAQPTTQPATSGATAATPTQTSAQQSAG